MKEKQIKQIYEKYSPMVYSRCKFILKDEERALDGMQDVFIKLLKRKNLFNIRVMAKYLYSMATTVSLDILRVHNRYREDSALPDTFADNRDWEKETLTHLNLKDFLQKLAPKDQTIIHLTFWQKMEQKEIAEIMGISVSAIKKRLHRIKKTALREKEYLYG